MAAVSPAQPLPTIITFSMSKSSTRRKPEHSVVARMASEHPVPYLHEIHLAADRIVAVSSNSGRYMYDDLMKPGHAGKRTAIFLPFLHVTFAVSSAHDERIVAWLLRHPVRFPKRPGEIAAGIINSGGVPRFAIIEAQLRARNPAVAAVGNAFHVDPFP